MMVGRVVMLAHLLLLLNPAGNCFVRQDMREEDFTSSLAFAICSSSTAQCWRANVWFEELLFFLQIADTANISETISLVLLFVKILAIRN